MNTTPNRDRQRKRVEFTLTTTPTRSMTLLEELEMVESKFNFVDQDVSTLYSKLFESWKGVALLSAHYWVSKAKYELFRGNYEECISIFDEASHYPVQPKDVLDEGMKGFLRALKEREVLKSARKSLRNSSAFKGLIHLDENTTSENPRLDTPKKNNTPIKRFTPKRMDLTGSPSKVRKTGDENLPLSVLRQEPQRTLTQTPQKEPLKPKSLTSIFNDTTNDVEQPDFDDFAFKQPFPKETEKTIENIPTSPMEIVPERSSFREIISEPSRNTDLEETIIDNHPAMQPEVNHNDYGGNDDSNEHIMDSHQSQGEHTELSEIQQDMEFMAITKKFDWKRVPSTGFGSTEIVIAHSECVTPQKRSIRLQSTTPYDANILVDTKDVVCKMCNKANLGWTMVKCSAKNCQSKAFYHVRCIGIKHAPIVGKWVCDECIL